MDDLEKKVRELKIFDLKPFYASTIFRNHGLRVDTVNRLIIKAF